MRRLFTTTIASLALLVAFAANAQVRGTGRLQGNVNDKVTGKPVAGATITISLPSGNTAPIVVKTDSRGHWAALGMTPGLWNIDIAAPGYNTSRGTANVQELRQTAAININLEPEVKQAPAAAVPTGPSIPKEAVALINEAQELMKVKAGDVVTTTQSTEPGASQAVSHTVTADEVKANAKKAVEDLEKAYPMVPDETAELKTVRRQIQEVMAQAYYKGGDLKGAIATLEKLNQIDPFTTPDANHVTRQVLLVNLYLENGQLEEGKALLDKLPAGAVTDPTAYVNIGILFLNKKNAADSITYFSKAIELDPKNADGYYYRGLAEVQLKKNKEAKADFQQVVALAPNSSEASDAKQMLQSLK